MFSKNSFALFFVAATMAVSPVSAGGIRGVSREQHVGITHGRRHLKSDKNTSIQPEVVSVSIPSQAVAPVPASVPVEPKGIDLWRARCNINRLEACAGAGRIEGCTQCLYAQSLLSSTSILGIRSCSNLLCNGCIDDATTYYECGLQSTSAPPPVVTAPVDSSGTVVTIPVEITPVVSTPVTIVDNSASIADQTTSTGCPLLEPEVGGDCTGLIPAPFKYHKCYYRDVICSCRNDSPYYLCNPRPIVVPVVEPPLVSTPIVPDTPAMPASDIPVVETFGCSDDPVSGSRCSTVSEECCVGGTNLCTCGSDLYFVCQSNDCAVEEPLPIIDDPATPAVEINVVDEGVPIPDYVDFSFASLWCPRNITNCDPCAEFLPEGEFNAACNADTTISYKGEPLSVQVQCRCATQNDADPTWQCRYIEGVEGTNIIPVSPSCNSTSVDPIVDTVEETPIVSVQEPVTEEVPVIDPVVAPVEETPIVSVPEPVEPITDPVADPIQEISAEPIEEVPTQPELITEIPPTKECRDRLPTSGVTPCQIPAGEICCHNVQFAIAKVCTCENGFFQCVDGVPSDCPDDQNPNIIPVLQSGVITP